MISVESTNTGRQRSSSSGHQMSSTPGQPIITSCNDSRVFPPIRPLIIEKRASRDSFRSLQRSMRDTFDKSMRSSPRKYDHFFKVLLLGPTNGGKTCFVKQFMNKEFIKEYQSTFGMQNYIKATQIDEEFVKLSIWDSPSDIRFSHQIESHIINSNAIIFIYDCTDEDSVQQTVKMIETLIRQTGGSKCQLFAIGTKKDKVATPLQMKSMYSEFAKENNIQLFSVSNKNAKLIEETLRCVVLLMIKNAKSQAVKNKSPYDFLDTSQEGSDSENEGSGEFVYREFKRSNSDELICEDDLSERKDSKFYKESAKKRYFQSMSKKSPPQISSEDQNYSKSAYSAKGPSVFSFDQSHMRSKSVACSPGGCAIF